MHCIRVMMRANLKRLNIRNELASYPAGKYRLLQAKHKESKETKGNIWKEVSALRLVIFQPSLLRRRDCLMLYKMAFLLQNENKIFSILLESLLSACKIFYGHKKQECTEAKSCLDYSKV